MRSVRNEARDAVYFLLDMVFPAGVMFGGVVAVLLALAGLVFCCTGLPVYAVRWAWNATACEEDRP